MLANIYTRSIRDAVLWTVSAMVILLALVIIALPAYSSFGEEYISLFQDMPDWLAVVYGEDNTSVAGLVGTALFTLMSPLVLLVYAIGMGTSAAVGEEEARTLPLLLANPLSRTRVLTTKAVVAGVGVALIVTVVWISVELVAGLVGIDLASQDILAASIHLAAFVLLFGALALAVAAWTGSSTLGIGLAAAIAVLSYIASTWLPIVEGLDGLAGYSPWHLYVGADALHRGVDVPLLLLTVGLAAVLFGTGVFGLRRRDLRG